MDSCVILFSFSIHQSARSWSCLQFWIHCQSNELADVKRNQMSLVLCPNLTDDPGTAPAFKTKTWILSSSRTAFPSLCESTAAPTSWFPNYISGFLNSILTWNPQNQNLMTKMYQLTVGRKADPKKWKVCWIHKELVGRILELYFVLLMKSRCKGFDLKILAQRLTHLLEH